MEDYKTQLKDLYLVGYPKYYKKAIKGVVGGRYINDLGGLDEFLLKGDPFKESTDEQAVIVEIFGPKEEKYFLKSNKAALVKGYLIAVETFDSGVDETNSVTDGQLKDLLKLPLNKMKVEVNKFTSEVPVTRLLAMSVMQNKPTKTVEYVKSALAKFSSDILDVSEVSEMKIGKVD